MIKSRNHDIVVSSQFNINGSRGRDAGKFIRDYISRASATDSALSYRNGHEVGDGVAFTLDATGISRAKTLKIADHVQDLFEEGHHAIQQMVISFDPDYLVRQGLVDPNTEIVKKGDYRGQYDDIRIRHAVRSGIASMIETDGYTDGRMISCIQWDTRHLHVHTVVWEDGQIRRWHGRDERGMLHESSLNQLAFDIDRRLDITKSKAQILVPSLKNLMPKDVETIHPAYSKPEEIVPKQPEMPYIDEFLEIINAKKREKLLKAMSSIDLDELVGHEEEQEGQDEQQSEQQSNQSEQQDEQQDEQQPEQPGFNL